MNRRAFLLGGTAALVVRSALPGEPEVYVDVAATIDIHGFMALQLRSEIERVVYEALFYGEGAGQPLGILHHA